MRALIVTAATALLGLSACNAPQGEDDEERTEQRDGGDEEDD